MSAKPLRRIGLLLAASTFALTSAGCGSNPPCETDLAAVDAARGAAKTAESKLTAAKTQQADLQTQIDAEKAKQAELAARKAELEAKIAELQK
ncbi:MAG: hypothetical protein DHS20C21_05080 [Gemmatimonadota bacterium]|nr:MAG: hypothetical protein DHS20C21_05080 [Gemmatimonadota bacterium]